MTHWLFNKWFSVQFPCHSFIKIGLFARKIMLLISGIPPHLLDLEITKSMAMEDPASLLEILHELKKIGVKISIDDFGTGFSSLNFLKQLPIDQLKIDRSFISKNVDARSDASIPKMIIQLCASLGLTVIAEGVEELNQAQTLMSLGCPLAQGFYYSKPLETLKLTEWLQEDRNSASEVRDQSAKITEA